MADPFNENNQTTLSNQEYWYAQNIRVDPITNSIKKTMGRKRYELLKDTPECKKGAIFEEMCDDGTQNYQLITPQHVRFSDEYEYYDEDNGNLPQLYRAEVEKNPTFFREVVEVSVPVKMVQAVKRFVKSFSNTKVSKRRKSKRNK
jgi:hypothetical protein